jgi:hypothetical protein
MRRTPLLAATLVVGVISPLPALLSGVVPWGWGFPASVAIVGMLVGWLGSVIDRAIPGHPVGRLFAIGGLVAVVYQLAIDLLPLIDAPWQPVIWSIFEHCLWMLPLALWFTGLALFPEGRWAFRAAPLVVGLGSWATFLVMLPVSAVLPALSPGIGPNPLVGEDQGAAAGEAAAMLSTVFQMTPLALALGHVTVFRRSSPLRRRQIGIVVAAIGVLGVTAIVSQAISNNVTTSIIAFIEMSSLAGVFVAIAVGITRYRLYDIDRLVSRTIAYAAVSTILGGVFVGGVLILSTLLGGLAEGQTLAVAASTLAAIALFQPLRTWMQRAVDRRFHRAGYDAAQIVEGFQGRIRNDLDLGSVGNALSGAVVESVRPTSLGIWLASERGGSDRP